MDVRSAVLLVDDDQNLLDSMKRQFHGLYDLLVAKNAREALTVIQDRPDIAVIVSDLRMPGENGIQLMASARDILPDAPRIMLTGHADLQNALEAINSGQVFRFLTKPCPIPDLTRAIDAGLAQHKLLRDQKELWRLKHVKEAMEHIILGFSSLVESRDPYTAGHQFRVTDLALAIASRLGLDQDRLTGLKMGALVHDIGKIYVPAKFLNKSGPLSDLEFAIIKQHPLVGQDILKSVDFHWPVSRIALEHHERLDGSGYPHGLRGADICQEARIVAVADVIDAMCSDRPYRPSLGVEEALAEIEAHRGRLYDPEAVDVCLELFRESGYLFPGPRPPSRRRSTPSPAP